MYWYKKYILKNKKKTILICFYVKKVIWKQHLLPNTTLSLSLFNYWYLIIEHRSLLNLTFDWIKYFFAVR